MKCKNGKYLLDHYDRSLLEMLTENSRRSYASMSREIGLPAQYVREKVLAMEEAGIASYTTKIDWAQVMA